MLFLNLITHSHDMSIMWFNGNLNTRKINRIRNVIDTSSVCEEVIRQSK